MAQWEVVPGMERLALHSIVLRLPLEEVHRPVVVQQRVVPHRERRGKVQEIVRHVVLPSYEPDNGWLLCKW